MNLLNIINIKSLSILAINNILKEAKLAEQFLIIIRRYYQIL